MMKIRMKAFVCATAVVASALISAHSLAATISINFTGMNLVYDGSAIYDAGSTVGGIGNPTDADPLTSVNFIKDGNLVGTLSSDVSLDVYIPDVTGISSAPNTVFNVTTIGNPGFFDLLIGTSPLASQFLLLDLSEVSVSYLDISGLMQFSFGAAVADSFAQNLPFGLEIGDPISVSFSAQVASGSRTTSGGFVTGFSAAGTGEISGPSVPEPATGLLLMLGALATVMFAHRRS